MQQLKNPEQILQEDLDAFLNANENQPIIKKMVILDQISKLLKRDNIDNIIDLIIHNEKLDTDLTKKIQTLNQNINSEQIKILVQNVFEDIQQKYSFKEDLKIPTEIQQSQFKNKFAGHHGDKCRNKANQICYHQNKITYFCNECQSDHKGCKQEDKIKIVDILKILYNDLTQSHTMNGIDITCKINPQLMTKLKLQSYDYMTGLKTDFNTNEFMIELFPLYRQIEQFNQVKKSIEEQIIIHRQRSAYQKIKIRQNEQCQHDDSKRICLESECKKVHIFCIKCANFHPDHVYLNEFDIKNIDLQQLYNMESLSQTFKFTEILQELINEKKIQDINNNQQVIDNHNQYDFNDQFLTELAKRIINNMPREQIQQIKINKFNILQAKQVQIKDWKTTFIEQVKCRNHPQATALQICLYPECNYQFICDNCQNDHQQHPSYDYTNLKPLYQDEFNKFVQLQKQNNELQELMMKIYFPDQYLDKQVLKQLTPVQFSEEVRQALIRQYKSQLKINRDNQILNDYLKSYLQAYFSSYYFQENLKQGLELVNQLNETPQIDDQLNHQQKQHFNEIVDITRLHKYTISFYTNMQLIFKEIYSRNFIQQDQYDFLARLTQCNNLDQKKQVIEEYSQRRAKFMITQGQSLLFRDIQQLVSKFNRYLGLDIIYILKQTQTQETIKCQNNIVQKLDLLVQTNIYIHGLLVRKSQSIIAQQIECELSVYKYQYQQQPLKYSTSINYNTNPGLDFIKLDFQQPQSFKANDKISIILNFKNNQEFYSSDIGDKLNYQNYFKIIQEDQELISIDSYIVKNQQKNRGIISAIIIKK